jgi:hypothetical protein
MAEMMRSQRNHWCLVSVLILVFAAGKVAQAAPAKLSMGLDNRYSDNAGKTNTDAQSDLESRITLQFSKSSDPGVCNSSIGGSLGYGYWYDDTFDPEFYTNGQFTGVCALSPYFSWQVSDRIRQVTQNSRNADTPDNRTRKNTFSTGPTYRLPITDVDTVSFSATFENTEFEESAPTDSNRLSGGISYSHLFNPTMQGGVSTSIGRTELDTGEELDTEAINLNLSKSWTTTSASGAVGANRLESRSGTQEISTDGVTFNLRLNRDVSDSSSVFVTANRQLTDRTSTIALAFEDFNFNLTDTSAVEVTAFQAGYRNAFSGGASFSVGVESSRSDYIESGNTEESQKATASISSPVSGVSSVSANVSYKLSSFDGGSDDQLVTTSIGYNHRLSQKLSLTSRVGHENKSSDVSVRDYQENWVSVSINYTFL